MAVVPVDAPSVQHTLVINEFMSGPSDVVHDFVLAALLQSQPNTRGQVVQNFIPGHALPFSFSPLAGPPQRIKNPLRVGDLIKRRRSFGAVPAAAARMSGVAFEFLHAHLVLVDVGQQAASSFTVEADSRNQRVMLLDFPRPLRGIVFGPVVPTIGRSSWRGPPQVRLGLTLAD